MGLDDTRVRLRIPCWAILTYHSVGGMIQEPGMREWERRMSENKLYVATRQEVKKLEREIQRNTRILDHHQKAMEHYNRALKAQHLALFIMMFVLVGFVIALWTIGAAVV